MVNRNPLAWHAEALEEVATSITEEAWLYSLAILCGMGPHGDGMLIGNARLMFGFQHKHINSIVEF